MEKKCLLISTKENKKFITSFSNFNKIKPFFNELKAEISVVNAENKNCLNLKDLAKAICQDNDKPLKYSFISIKIPSDLIVDQNP